MFNSKYTSVLQALLFISMALIALGAQASEDEYYKWCKEHEGQAPVENWDANQHICHCYVDKKFVNNCKPQRIDISDYKTLEEQLENPIAKQAALDRKKQLGSQYYDPETKTMYDDDKKLPDLDTKAAVCDSRLSGFFDTFKIPGTETKTIDNLKNWNTISDQRADATKSLLKKQLSAAGFKNCDGVSNSSMKVGFAFAGDSIAIGCKGNHLRIKRDGSVEVNTADGGENLVNLRAKALKEGRGPSQVELKNAFDKLIPNNIPAEAISSEVENIDGKQSFYIKIGNGNKSKDTVEVLADGTAIFASRQLDDKEQSLQGKHFTLFPGTQFFNVCTGNHGSGSRVDPVEKSSK